MHMSTASTRRKFVRTVPRYRTIEIQAGAHTITIADPMPADLRDASTPPTGVQIRINGSQVGNTSTMSCRLRSDVSAVLPKK